MSQIETTAEDWMAPPAEPENLPAEHAETWTLVRGRVVELARRFGWSRGEIAKRSGVSAGTLYPWLDGTTKGRYDTTAERLRKWLDSVEELSVAAARVPAAPGFVELPTSRKMIDTLLYAQMMPEMVIVNLGAGLTKTITAKHYADNRPHVFLVTMRPTTASTNNMLRELCEVFDIRERDPAKLDRAIGEKLKRNGRNTLLIVDEAQELTDQAVNQLRSYLDLYGVGIALLGNEELYSRFGGSKPKPAYAQLHGRTGMRLQQLQPSDDDISMLLDAWQLDDPALRRLATAIARKPGALRQMTKTLQLAGIYAAGEQRDISIDDVKAAIRNRGLEDH